MADPLNHIGVILKVANSGAAATTSWPALKYTLLKAKFDTTTIDQADTMRLFRDIHRAIEKERQDGMRDASREHISAILRLANQKDLPDPKDIDWIMLKLWLEMENPGIEIPDSADWLRSFLRFCRNISGEEVEQDIPQHAAQPSRFEGTLADSSYGSHDSEIDPEFVTVILDSCEKYKDGRLSSPCIVSDNNEKHCMTQSAAKHCNLRPDQYGDVSLTYCVKGNTEPATVLCQVVPDDQEEADIVFSRKAFYAEKNKNSSTTLLGDQRRHRDSSRSARSSSTSFEEEDQAASYAIGVALQSAAVRGLSDKQIENLGYKAKLATRAARNVPDG